MINKKNLLLGLTTGLLVGAVYSNTAHALDQDVDASIITKAAISMTKNTDMAFGTVEFAAVHSGDIQLGTDGTVVLSGTAGLTLGATATTAGDVSISGDGASTVDISCETGATLAEAGGATLTLTAAEVTLGSGGAPGSGTACAGLGTASLTNDFSATATPTLLMGGTINVDGNAITSSSTYSTTIGAGNPVTLRVTYQ